MLPSKKAAKKTVKKARTKAAPKKSAKKAASRRASKSPAKKAPPKRRAPRRPVPVQEPGPWTTLVTAAQLAPHVGSPRVVILDVRHNLKDPHAGPRLYAEGHIPGAVHAHVDVDLSARPSPRTGRHPLPDVDAWVETCSKWGIAEGVQVVCYDDWGGAWASRAWWLLRYYGHRSVAVLDGGIQAWTAANHPVVKDAPRPEPRRFSGTPGAMPVVTAWDIMTRAPRCLVDARGPTRYRGEEEPVDPVAGHIPMARNVPFVGNVDKDGFFLSRQALRARYEALLDGLPATDAAFYCGSGVTAPHDILAMEIAGLPGAALYPGSWSEWIRDPLRPVVKGEE